MKYICMLLPALISVDYEIKKKDTVINILACYAKYCIIINFLVFILLILMGRMNASLKGTDSIIFYAIYLFSGFIFAVVLPRIINYIRKNFFIKIKRVKHEEK